MHGQPSILVELPRSTGNKSQAIDTLLGTGTPAFWDTGAVSLMSGTSFNPDQYSQYNPGGRPLFTGQDLDPTALAVITVQPTGQPAISGMMKGSAISRFAVFTKTHIGDYLTITLDGKVISSEIIQAEINGPFVIMSNFTLQQANAIVAVLKYGLLPVNLKQLG